MNNDRLRHILQQLADPHGNLDPATVVDAATPATSPLHDYFTWDDGEAADKWRLDEARQLIRRVRITVIPQPDTPPIRVRAFVSVDGAGENETRAYRPLADVANDDELRERVLAEARRDLQLLTVKYRHLGEAFTALLAEHANTAA